MKKLFSLFMAMAIVQVIATPSANSEERKNSLDTQTQIISNEKSEEMTVELDKTPFQIDIHGTNFIDYKALRFWETKSSEDSRQRTIDLIAKDGNQHLLQCKLENNKSMNRIILRRSRQPITDKHQEVGIAALNIAYKECLHLQEVISKNSMETATLYPGYISHKDEIQNVYPNAVYKLVIKPISIRTDGLITTEIISDPKLTYKSIRDLTTGEISHQNGSEMDSNYASHISNSHKQTGIDLSEKSDEKTASGHQPQNAQEAK